MRSRSRHCREIERYRRRRRRRPSYEPLSKHTTLRVAARRNFGLNRDETALSELIRFCRRGQSHSLCIGRGSNLLVRDGGIRGVVVHPSAATSIRSTSTETKSPPRWREAKRDCYAARRQIWADWNGWKEYPARSARATDERGAMGAQTFEKVVRVRYLDGEGNAHDKSRRKLEVHYRHFPLLEQNFAVSAHSRGSPAPRDKLNHVW